MQSPPHLPTTTTITTTTITTTTTTNATTNHQESSTFSTTTKRQLLPPHTETEQLQCPRCQSLNTKFCYYNNYNTSQPRHLCKSCRRYWTHGGALRHIPVGGGSRRNAKRQKLDKPSSGCVTTSSSTPVEYRSLVPSPPLPAAGNVMVPFDGNGFMSFFGLGGFEHGVWPFCGDGHGGGGGGGGGRWQVESGGEGGGGRFVMPELAISTPSYGAAKTEDRFVMPELAISTPSYGAAKTEDRFVMPELAISTPSYGVAKTEDRFVMPELAISTPSYGVAKTEDRFVMPELAISTPSYGAAKTEDHFVMSGLAISTPNYAKKTEAEDKAIH